MITRLESGSQWLAARIGDFEKWQARLLEESASRVALFLIPGAGFTATASSARRSHSAGSGRGCGSARSSSMR